MENPKAHFGGRSARLLRAEAVRGDGECGGDADEAAAAFGALAECDGGGDAMYGCLERVLCALDRCGGCALDAAFGAAGARLFAALLRDDDIDVRIAASKCVALMAKASECVARALADGGVVPVLCSVIAGDAVCRYTYFQALRMLCGADARAVECFARTVDVEMIVELLREEEENPQIVFIENEGEEKRCYILAKEISGLVYNAAKVVTDWETQNVLLDIISRCFENGLRRTFYFNAWGLYKLVMNGFDMECFNRMGLIRFVEYLLRTPELALVSAASLCVAELYRKWNVPVVEYVPLILGYAFESEMKTKINVYLALEFMMDNSAVVNGLVENKYWKKLIDVFPDSLYPDKLIISRLMFSFLNHINFFLAKEIIEYRGLIVFDFIIESSEFDEFEYLSYLDSLIKWYDSNDQLDFLLGYISTDMTSFNLVLQCELEQFPSLLNVLKSY